MKKFGHIRPGLGEEYCQSTSNMSHIQLWGNKQLYLRGGGGCLRGERVERKRLETIEEKIGKNI